MVQTRSWLEGSQASNTILPDVQEINTRESQLPPPRVELATIHHKEQFDTNYAESGEKILAETVIPCHFVDMVQPTNNNALFCQLVPLPFMAFSLLPKARDFFLSPPKIYLSSLFSQIEAPISHLSSTAQLFNFNKK